MKKVYVVCVEGNYLKAIENFEVSFTNEINNAIFYTYEDAISKVNILKMLGYNATASQYKYKEIEDPKMFTKKGLFAIKLNDGSYWTWDYYGNIKSNPYISKDAFLTSYKECLKRMKYQNLTGKAIQIQN